MLDLPTALKAYGGGGVQYFFNKNNIGYFIKAWSTNYRPVFIE